MLMIRSKLEAHNLWHFGIPPSLLISSDDYYIRLRDFENLKKYIDTQLLVHFFFEFLAHCILSFLTIFASILA